MVKKYPNSVGLLSHKKHQPQNDITIAQLPNPLDSEEETHCITIWNFKNGEKAKDLSCHEPSISSLKHMPIPTLFSVPEKEASKWHFKNIGGLVQSTGSKDA